MYRLKKHLQKWGALKLILTFTQLATHMCIAHIKIGYKSYSMLNTFIELGRHLESNIKYPNGYNTCIEVSFPVRAQTFSNLHAFCDCVSLNHCVLSIVSFGHDHPVFDCR